MTAEQFAYWLQGFVELTIGRQPTPEQWKSVTEHLGTVFNKVTPPVRIGPGPYPRIFDDGLRDHQRAIGPRPWFDGQAIQITC
jgi:hypothetical protein